MASTADREIWLNGSAGKNVLTQYYDEEIAKKQKETENLENDIKRMVLLKKHMKMTDEEFQLMPLIQRLADIENRNRVLREIIERQQYTYTSKELEAIAKKHEVACISKTMLMRNKLLLKYMFEILMPFLTKI